MSKEIRDQEFWDMTDEFIQLANKQCDNHRNGKVSTAALFSAARFNAFMYASTAKDFPDFVDNKTMALDYFTEQYRQALKENLEDYQKNFKDYLETK